MILRRKCWRMLSGFIWLAIGYSGEILWTLSMESVLCGTRWSFVMFTEQNKQSPWPESVSELYRLNDRLFSAKLVPTFAHGGCHVVSAADPYGRILGFLNRSRYFFFQAAPRLYSRGWVDPVPDPLLLRKSGSAGNRTRTSGSVARTCS
jgi:hypothetical protein